MVQCWVLCAAQQPTYNQVYKLRVIVWAEGDEETACQRPHHLPGKYEGPTVIKTSDRTRGI